MSSTPTPTPSMLKKTSSSGGQRTLHGFFAKPATPSSTGSLPVRVSPRKPGLNDRLSAPTRSSQLTPQPSSDAVEPEQDYEETNKASQAPTKRVPSPVSADEGQTNFAEEVTVNGTPSRKVRPSLFSLADLTFHRQSRRRSAMLTATVKAPVTTMSSNLPHGDGHGRQRGGSYQKARTKMCMSRTMSLTGDEGMKESLCAAHLLTRTELDDFIAPDDSEEDVRPKKRKQASKGTSRKPSREASSHFADVAKNKSSD